MEETMKQNQKERAGKWARRALGITALLTGSAVALAAHAEDKAPVRIGIVTSLSGVFAAQGTEVSRGVQFAVAEANAKGGIDGRKVDAQVSDDESTPDAGRRVAEKLARSGYNLLTGAVPSSIPLAIVQNLDRWDALYFTVASKSDRLTGDSCRARQFRTSHSDAMDLAMISQWTKEFKEKNFAIMGADYVWGRDSGESFQRAIQAQGKTVSLALYAPMGTKDFSPYIAQLKASKAEAIWVAEVGGDAIAFIKQAREFGLIPAKKLIGHALIMNFVVNATGDALENVVGTTTYGPEIDTPLNKAFVAAWKARYNRTPTDNEAQGYNGAQVIFEGVRKSASVKPVDIEKALDGDAFDTIYGKVTMRAKDHQLMLPNYVAQVKKVDGALRPVVIEQFPASLTPPASPLCKM